MQILTLISWLLFSISSIHAWELEKSNDGIKIFTNEIEGSDFKAFRGKKHITAQLSDVLMVIKNLESIDDWLHEYIKSQIIEQVSENEIIVYQETSAPWPITNRNFVLKMKVSQTNPNKAVVRFSALVEPDVPDQDCVRVTELIGGRTLTRETPTLLHIICETSADPAGDIPA
ncbi:MAG: START domain-containing protein [Oleiphilaceae bacterium]|nr:START domain-containing protein [Oleiphilaceae bacterium]